MDSIEPTPERVEAAEPQDTEAESTETKSSPKPRARKKKAATAAGFSVPKKEGWYVIGLRPGPNGQRPPKHVVTWAGLSWPVYSHDENPTIKNDTIEYNQRRTGQRIYLYPEDLERIESWIGKKIVRARSEKRGTYAVLSRTARGVAGRPMRGDLPIEAFLYITPSEEPAGIDGPEFPDDFPEPLGEYVPEE